MITNETLNDVMLKGLYKGESYALGLTEHLRVRLFGLNQSEFAKKINKQAFISTAQEGRLKGESVASMFAKCGQGCKTFLDDNNRLANYIPKELLDKKNRPPIKEEKQAG